MTRFATFTPIWSGDWRRRREHRVRLLPPARSDLIRVSNFLADVPPGAALRAADVLDEALRTLRTFPERAPKNRIGGRDMIVRFGQAGYVIRYRVVGADVIVTHLPHFGRSFRLIYSGVQPSNGRT